MAIAPTMKGTPPYFNAGIRVRTAPVASASASVTLKNSQSGQTFLFDRASGVTYTLPTPKVGIYYNFYTSVLQTSGAYVVVTNAGTVFVTGAIVMFSGEDVTPSNLLGPKMFAGNGTNHIKYTSNATTTGGGIGTSFRVTCISTTLWYFTGIVKSPSGTIATPFSVTELIIRSGKLRHVGA